MSSKVVDILREYHWSISEGESDAGFYHIRFRVPVPAEDEVEGYGIAIRILWTYAEEGSGALPTDGQAGDMDAFETGLCAVLEAGAHAILAAVLTFDGARQWVFYTGDVAECGRRIETMPPTEEPCPVELDGFEDPQWHYLRNEILGNVRYHS